MTKIINAFEVDKSNQNKHNRHFEPDDNVESTENISEPKVSTHFEFEFDYSKILPTNDLIFKRIFWNKEHPDILICFLNAILRREDPITSVELINTEMDDQFIGKHGIRLDLLGRTNNGELLNIEMQNSNNDNMFKRSLYYWSKVYSSQLDQGQAYERLVPVIAINILDFNLFEDNRCQRKFIITDEKTGKDDFKMLEIHFIELRKRKYMTDNDELLAWTEFLKSPNSPNSDAIEVKTSTKNRKAISNAKGIYSTAIASNEEREKIRLLNKTLTDNVSRVISARNEGLAEGEHNAKIETARKMLSKGAAVDFVSECTGLSIDKILKLQ